MWKQKKLGKGVVEVQIEVKEKPGADTKQVILVNTPS